MTPLHFACQAGRVANVEILLKKAKSSKYLQVSVTTVSTSLSAGQMSGPPVSTSLANNRVGSNGDFVGEGETTNIHYQCISGKRLLATFGNVTFRCATIFISKCPDD